MPVTVVSSRAFNQDTGSAKKAAAKGPVFITDRGRPAHVLLSIEEYWRLTGRPDTIVDALGRPAGVADIEVAFPRMRDLAGGADLS